MTHLDKLNQLSRRRPSQLGTNTALAFVDGRRSPPVIAPPEAHENGHPAFGSNFAFDPFRYWLRAAKR